MTKEKQEMGRKARKSGGIFERRVRADLEANGFIVSKWNNQVDLVNNKLIPAPHKFNFFTKSITPGQGFPDFIAYRQAENLNVWEIVGVESKSAKYLDKDEKAKCEWMINHRIFDKIIIAYKDKAGHIQYYDYEGE